MPGILGPFIEAAITMMTGGLAYITSMADPEAGESIGASVQMKMDFPVGEFASAGNELVGKIGPIVSIYDPEGVNRMIGEWE